MYELNKPYGKGTCKQLVAELKKRNSKTTGKTADLDERLINGLIKCLFILKKNNVSFRICRLSNYDKICVQPIAENDNNSYFLETPDPTIYKDLNSSQSLSLNADFYSKYLTSVNAYVNS